MASINTTPATFFLLAGVVRPMTEPHHVQPNNIFQTQLFYELAYELVMCLVGMVQLRLSRFSETNIVTATTRRPARQASHYAKDNSKWDCRAGTRRFAPLPSM